MIYIYIKKRADLVGFGNWCVVGLLAGGFTAHEKGNRRRLGAVLLCSSAVESQKNQVSARGKRGVNPARRVEEGPNTCEQTDLGVAMWFCFCLYSLGLLVWSDEHDHGPQCQIWEIGTLSLLFPPSLVSSSSSSLLILDTTSCCWVVVLRRDLFCSFVHDTHCEIPVHMGPRLNS